MPHGKPTEIEKWTAPKAAATGARTARSLLAILRSRFTQSACPTQQFCGAMD